MLWIGYSSSCRAAAFHVHIAPTADLHSRALPTAALEVPAVGGTADNTSRGRCKVMAIVRSEWIPNRQCEKTIKRANIDMCPSSSAPPQVSSPKCLLRKSKKQILNINEHPRESMNIYGHPQTNLYLRTSTNNNKHQQRSKKIFHPTQLNKTLTLKNNPQPHRPTWGIYLKFRCFWFWVLGLSYNFA